MATEHARREINRHLIASGMPPLNFRSGEDRRKQAMTSSEVEDWLKRNGIQGEDRRKRDRRQERR